MVFGWRGLLRWIDPGRGGQRRRLRHAALEPQGLGGVGKRQGLGALSLQGLGGAVMDGVRAHQADAAVAVLVVVPVEEALTVRASVLERAEARGEVGPVLQGLELRFRVRVVIRDMRAAVGAGDIEIDQQLRDGLGAHARAPIGMQGEGAWGDVLLGDRLGDELLGELG